MRREALVGGAAAVGAAAGLVIALLSGSSEQAAATLSVADRTSIIAGGTVAAFARSSVVADNVAQALHVPAARVRGRLRARAVHGTALVELVYSDSSAARAEQGVQQAANVVVTLVPSRFPGVAATVVDPARARSVGPPLVRDGALGAAAGLALGGLLLLRRQPRPEPAREHAAPAPPPVEPEPEPDLEPDPDPARPPAPPEPAWAAELRAALAAHGAAFGADQVAEWEAYLAAFEAQAVDGELPSRLQAVCADVFEPLLERARA